MQIGAFGNLGWIKIVFVGVVALGLGFWQLWSINREIGKDKGKGGVRGRVMSYSSLLISSLSIKFPLVQSDRIQM